jgi:hypothetical protein
VPPGQGPIDFPDDEEWQKRFPPQPLLPPDDQPSAEATEEMRKGVKGGLAETPAPITPSLPGGQESNEAPDIRGWAKEALASAPPTIFESTPEADEALGGITGPMAPSEPRVPPPSRPPFLEPEFSQPPLGVQEGARGESGGNGQAEVVRVLNEILQAINRNAESLATLAEKIDPGYGP